MQTMQLTTIRGALISLLAAGLLILAGCGSTEVINADKTLVVRDTVYNIADVKVYSSTAEAIMESGENIDLMDADKKRINALLDEYGSLMVKQTLIMDEQEIVYQSRTIDSWRDYSKMQKSFERANKDLRKFLAEPKKMQLEL